MKKLRKQNPEKISYYTAGEYGSERTRPHYHSIMFNLDLEIILGKSMAWQCINFPHIYMDGKYQLKDKIWNMGYITIGRVEGASIAYTLEYLQKGRIIPQHKHDDREKEFSLMSKKLGNNYLTKQTLDWHTKDKKTMPDRFYLPLKDGYAAPMPRYYKEKIYTQFQRTHIGAKIARRENSKTAEEKLLDKNKIANLERKSKKERQTIFK